MSVKCNRINGSHNSLSQQRVKEIMEKQYCFFLRPFYILITYRRFCILQETVFTQLILYLVNSSKEYSYRLVQRLVFQSTADPIKLTTNILTITLRLVVLHSDPSHTSLLDVEIIWHSITDLLCIFLPPLLLSGSFPVMQQISDQI